MNVQGSSRSGLLAVIFVVSGKHLCHILFWRNVKIAFKFAAKLRSTFIIHPHRGRTGFHAIVQYHQTCFMQAVRLAVRCR